MDKSQRCPTGIRGFDSLCHGGFIRNSLNLISGGTGTGKSIFAMQFLYDGAKNLDEPGIFFSFEEDIEGLRKDAEEFGWNFFELEEQKKIRFVYFYPYEIGHFLSLMEKEINSIGAKRVVIDSTSTFGMFLENEYEVRKELYAIGQRLKKMDCTVILTSEITEEASSQFSSGARLSRFGVEEFVADSVITMHFGGLGGPGDRALRIIKMRRTKHAEGPIPFDFSKNGLVIRPKKKRFQI